MGKGLANSNSAVPPILLKTVQTRLPMSVTCGKVEFHGTDTDTDTDIRDVPIV